MSDFQQQRSTAGNDVEITGSISFKGELVFDGKLKDGAIKGKTLSVGSGARVEGNIEAESLVISGNVTGNVTVTAKCDLKSTAQLHGNLSTTRLVMEDGATLIGQAQIRPAGHNAPPPPPAKK
jgi:cytoskeletal protein CcmA (bactofilin family)